MKSADFMELQVGADQGMFREMLSSESGLLSADANLGGVPSRQPPVDLLAVMDAIAQINTELSERLDRLEAAHNGLNAVVSYLDRNPMMRLGQWFRRAWEWLNRPL